MFGKTKQGNITWLCVCACDPDRRKTCVVPGNHLLISNTSSCGCLHKEQLVLRNTTHGQTKNGDVSKTYMCWQNMWGRVTNSNREDWKHYGGRGIKVCDPRWKDFSNFLVDMGIKPDGLTLDRTDVDEGYSKDNCRWVPQRIQCRNQRVRKDNKTGVKGVFIYKGRCYGSRSKVDRKDRHLGYYPLTSEGFEKACAARRLAEFLYWESQ